MSNKGIPIWKKILFSLVFPFNLLLHCFLFVFGDNKQEKIWWNNTIYNIREEYDKDSFTAIGYSFFCPLFGFILYITISIICKMLSGVPVEFYIIGIILILLVAISKIIITLKLKKKAKLKYIFLSIIIVLILYVIVSLCYFNAWLWQPIAFFSIALAIGALFVSIIIALTLKRKTVEDGVQFMNQLYKHINYLKHIPLKDKEKQNTLYIIVPNINIGTGINYSFASMIEDNRNILFKFICKTIDNNIFDDYFGQYKDGGDISESTVADKLRSTFNNSSREANEMLHYLYTWYHEDIGKLKSSAIELKKILANENGNVEIIAKYDYLCNNLGNKIGGYLSDKECLLGHYEIVELIKKEKQEKKEKKIAFRGEIIISNEFIEIVKSYIKDKTE